jgi:hypothetical protein
MLTTGLFIVVSWLMTSRIIRPLAAIATNDRKRAEMALQDSAVQQAKLLAQVQEQAQALQQAKAQAEAASQARRSFLANISHELRTPLNIILGFTQVLSHDPLLNPEQRKTVQTIHRSSDHLLHLINDVLDLSKIEAGQITIDERIQALTAGCHDYVMKPSRGEVFFGKMTAHLGLQYIYADADATGQDQFQVQSPPLFSAEVQAALAMMPEAWMSQLRQAAVRCDDEYVYELIEQIPPELASLATTLKHLVDDFQFAQLTQLIEHCCFQG